MSVLIARREYSAERAVHIRLAVDISERRTSALSVALDLSERVSSCPYALLMLAAADPYGSLTTL
jgi:hypothetical protein